jgi:predicted aspartyl protease
MVSGQSAVVRASLDPRGHWTKPMLDGALARASTVAVLKRLVRVGRIAHGPARLSSMVARLAHPRQAGCLMGMMALALSACQDVACTRVPVATLKLMDEPSGLYVAAVIDGQPAKLLLDTGSPMSLLTSETVHRLGLYTEHMLDDSDVLIGYAIEGIGGRRHTDLAWTRKVELGASPVLGVHFRVVLSRNTGWDPTGDGILGMDMLSRYDLDMDVGHGRLALYQPGELCAPPAAAQAHTMTRPQDMGLAGPRLAVTIGGQAFEALIDTGAQRSSIMSHAAGRLGPPPEGPGAPFEIYGVGTGHITAAMRSFDGISVGGIALPRLQMAVVGAPGFNQLDVILGEDVLRHVHAWLWASRHTVIVADNGRPTD